MATRNGRPPEGEPPATQTPAQEFKPTLTPGAADRAHVGVSPALLAILDRVADPAPRLLDDARVDVAAIRTVLAKQLRKPGTKADLVEAIDAAYSLTVDAAESLDELRDHLEPRWTA